MPKKTMGEKITDKVKKGGKVTPKEYKKLMKELQEMMGPRGLACGEELIKVAREIHGDNVEYAIPLYRSAIIILKKTKAELERGACTMILYHDPHWMGQDINKDTLPNFKDTLQLYGQRSGPDLYINNMRLRPITPEEEKQQYDRLKKLTAKSKKGKGKKVVELIV